MSYSALIENGKEMSEMQKVTMLLCMMEYLIFLDTELTNDAKEKVIDHSKISVGLDWSKSVVERIHKSWNDQREAKVAISDFKPKGEGNVGRNSKFASSFEAKFVIFIEKHAYSFRTLTKQKHS